MPLEHLGLLAVIAALSVVQSIFGMGILVFGTPTLLLLGYDFATTLTILLPASFAISLLQVIEGRSEHVPISKNLYLLCLPAICIGLWLSSLGPAIEWTNTLVGTVLVLSALVRIVPKMRNALVVLLQRFFPTYHTVMGLVHGLTNLGGALLAILASTTGSGKVAVRHIVAHYYLMFSTMQMLFLGVFLGLFDGFLINLLGAAVSAAIYLFVGRRIFSRASNPAFNAAMTVFMAAYGLVVISRPLFTP